jgi:hypothetical protein
MYITVISHIYNEEYLLPFWLEHHKNIFNHGIFLDYNSTDKTREIIKKICPLWEIRNSKNDKFDGFLVDEEVKEVESTIDGYKIVLNITEFIIPLKPIHECIDNNIDCYAIQTYIPIAEEYKYPKTLYEFMNGFDYINTNIVYRPSYRFLHKFKPAPYLYIGRHVINANYKIFDDIVLLWCGYYPMNEDMLLRKTQFAIKQSSRDIITKVGGAHQWNRDKILQVYHSILTDEETKKINFYNELNNYRKNYPNEKS